MDPISVNIDINQLLRSGLTVNEFFICYLIFSNGNIQLRYYEENIEKFREDIYEDIIKKGYLKSKIRNYIPKSGNNLKVTGKFTDLIKRVDDVVDNWIDEWIDLWPKGATSGGYYIRGDKRSSKHKMKQFRKAYPEFTKEVIFEATRRYIMRMAIENYKYSKLSHYFIFKESNSTLASECEIIKDEHLSSTQPTVTAYGEDEL